MKNKTFTIKSWQKQELTYSNINSTLNIILGTSGCFWAKKSGCTMCGYINDSPNKPFKDLNILKEEVEKYENIHSVKIFTSGSFLDPREIPKDVQIQIAKYLDSKDIKELSVESRPEFISQKNLKNLKNFSGVKEISIGLETSNDKIRNRYINKGFTYNDFLKACKICRENNFKIKAYVLIKPPFLYENQAIDDAIKSAHDITNYVDTISFNPCVVMKNTLISKLFPKSYKPPYLWSAHKVVKECIELKNRILCDIMGAATKRGAHNCKNCNKIVIENIKKMIETQKKQKAPRCGCKKTYDVFLENETKIGQNWEKILNLYQL